MSCSVLFETTSDSNKAYWIKNKILVLVIDQV
jgi:hypothetical protein